MLKKLLITELTRVFGCPEETVVQCSTKMLQYSLAGLAIIFLTFYFVMLATSEVAMMWAEILSILLAIECWIMYLLLGFFISIIFIYYLVYFGRRGWNRH